jgi:HPr kinase/phosphorylase
MPAFDGAGILITGPAQSGKSSLALALIEAGGLLVSDDQTLITPAPQGLLALPPEGMGGLIEIAGYGIVQLSPKQVAESAKLKLYITLLPPKEPLLRLPDDNQQQVLMVKMLALKLRSHDPAAVAKIKTVLTAHLIDYTDV